MESTSYSENGFISTFQVLFSKFYDHTLLLYILILKLNHLLLKSTYLILFEYLLQAHQSSGTENKMNQHFN
jgi:hypothetical protein